MANAFYGGLKGQGSRKAYRAGTIVDGIQSWTQGMGFGTIHTKLWFDPPKPIQSRKVKYEVRLYFNDIVFTGDLPEDGFMVLARGELAKERSTTDAAAATAPGNMNWPL
jgi:hypothetical protein